MSYPEKPRSHARATLVAILVVGASLMAAVSATMFSGATSSTVVFAEDFEGAADARVAKLQNAAPLTSGSDGAETAWNLINTASTTNVLTWPGPDTRFLLEMLSCLDRPI